MDKLVDFVQWMGDFPVEATGLRDADALVLCALSYFDLRPLLAEGDAEAFPLAAFPKSTFERPIPMGTFWPRSLNNSGISQFLSHFHLENPTYLN